MAHPMSLVASQLRLRDDPILHTPSKKVKEPIQTKIHALIKHMIQQCDDLNGLGLAAPQVGVPLRILIARIHGEIVTMINPKIHEMVGDATSSIEGCLSYPGERYEVMRHPLIDISYTAPAGIRIRQFFDGLGAIIIQHEVQHLEGKTIADIGRRVEDPNTVKGEVL